jgi:hypothetical protein
MKRGVQTKKTQIRSWFNKGVAALQRVVPDAPLCYGCPLCRRGFPEQKIDLLTCEHVPPASLGGHRLILTCKDCNGRAGGKSGIDTHARRAEHVLDFAVGTMETPRPAECSVGSLKQRVEVYRSSGGLFIRGLPGNNPPETTRQIQQAMERMMIGQGHSFTISLSKETYSEPHERVSWLRAAYLAAFAALGYRYILRNGLNLVRQQIFEPDKKIIECFSISDPDASPERRLIILVSEPDWVRDLAVAMGRHIVLLPPLYTNDTDFYERLGSAVAAGSKAELKGNQQLTWPRGPAFVLDFTP